MQIAFVPTVKSAVTVYHPVFPAVTPVANVRPFVVTATFAEPVQRFVVAVESIVPGAPMLYRIPMGVKNVF